MGLPRICSYPRWALDTVSVKSFILAALLIPIFAFRFYVPPERLILVGVHVQPVDTIDPSIEIGVRNCAKFAVYEGQFWYRTASFDQKVCFDQPANQRLVGNFAPKAVSGGHNLRITYVYGCKYCHNTSISWAKFYGGALKPEAMPTEQFTFPPFHLNTTDQLVVSYTVNTVQLARQPDFQ